MATNAQEKVLDAVDNAIDLLMRSGRSGLICADKLNTVRPTIAALCTTLPATQSEWPAFHTNGLHELIAALERAEWKGYLPEALLEPLEAFDFIPASQPTPNHMIIALCRYRDAHDAVQANPAMLLSDPSSWEKCAAGMAELEAARNELFAFIGDADTKEPKS